MIFIFHFSFVQPFYQHILGTYAALLNRLTGSEKKEIDRLNHLTILGPDDMPSNKTLAKLDKLENEDSTCPGQEGGEEELPPSPTKKSPVKDATPSVPSVSRPPSPPPPSPLEPVPIPSSPEPQEASPIKVTEPPVRPSRSRKRPHDMPHLVTLNSKPKILVTEQQLQQQNEKGTVSDKDSATSPQRDLEEPVTFNQSRGKQTHRCPECQSSFSTNFTKFRHLVASHPESNSAKQAWEDKSKRERQARQRFKKRALSKPKAAAKPGGSVPPPPPKNKGSSKKASSSTKRRHSPERKEGSKPKRTRARRPAPLPPPSTSSRKRGQKAAPAWPTKITHGKALKRKTGHSVAVVPRKAPRTATTAKKAKIQYQDEYCSSDDNFEAWTR